MTDSAGSASPEPDRVTRDGTGRSDRTSSGPGLLAYGVEAPYVPVMMTAAGVLSLIAWAFGLGGLWLLIVGVIFLAQAAIFLYATLVGKLQVWKELLDDLKLTGHESTLDLGCGRGAVLIAAAARLTDGQAVGIDLWRTKDQSGNSSRAAEQNARSAEVHDRVRFVTGDMTSLPYPDDSFDVVTSALAVHNIRSPEGREKAMHEALRVLRPGGRLIVVDFRNIEDYRSAIGDQRDVAVRPLGPRYWYGGPWTGASALTATKA